MSEFVQSLSLEEMDGERRAQFDKFIADFNKEFQGKPDYVVCSPGRVNLIGDHIDYHGFAVLPMAIEKSIWLGCAVNAAETGLSIRNTYPSEYEPQDLPHSLRYGRELDKSHRWHNYILCGYHGTIATDLYHIEPRNIYQHAHETDLEILGTLGSPKLSDLPQLRILVGSSLPAASGLSSSSALVCGSALAAKLFLKQHQVDSRELADACSKFEHLIGTHGGGMDQAVIMTAQQGYAKFVEFMPRLRCENVKLPEGTVWLVSHSGVNYPKAATSGYNARVLETKLGAAIIAKTMNATGIKLDKSITLSAIKQELYRGRSTQYIVNHIRDHVFHNISTFSVNQVCERLEISRSDMIERFDTTDKFLKDELNDKLELLLRCEHVFEEAERVQKFKSICDTTTDISLLGQLMTQSHYSLRDRYCCSHPALDRLVATALDAGALGSRLTGAGWGGCVVTLVESEKCETVYARLADISKFTFRSEPQAGCQILKISPHN